VSSSSGLYAEHELASDGTDSQIYGTDLHSNLDSPRQVMVLVMVLALRLQDTFTQQILGRLLKRRKLCLPVYCSGSRIRYMKGLEDAPTPKTASHLTACVRGVSETRHNRRMRYGIPNADHSL
jgi:hypothetical protein